MQDIARLRLRNQLLTRPLVGTPADVVSRLGAVQAQDFAGAKWALGMRLRSARENGVERAFDNGEILRTHVLRPTWHFVTPADIRWMLALSAARVHAGCATGYRKLEIDATVAARSEKALVHALRGHTYMTRDELRDELEDAGIETRRMKERMMFLLMRAELDAVICSGPRRGKQFTYALLDERVPAGKSLARADALAELARRFFATRGPATVHDFAKWGWLTVKDATSAVMSVDSSLEHETVDGRTYWFPPARPSRSTGVTAHLLSVYDEYITGYRFRDAMVAPKHAARLTGMGQALINVVIVDGWVVGVWKRTLRKDAVEITTRLFIRASARQRGAIRDAAERYGEFLGLPVVMSKTGL